MVLTTPEPLTAADPNRPVYWTQFPATAIQARWDDPTAAHKAVMRLFPQHLPGPQRERRLNAGVLFRIDNVGGQPTVLIQSMVPPETLPPTAKTMTVTDRGWAQEEGATIALRVAVNPLIRGKELRPDGTKRDVTRGIVSPDQIQPWLAARTQSVLTDILIVSHYRDTYRASGIKPGAPKRTLVIDTIDALATVTNPTALDTLRREGIGRAKAYGCGLITARPAQTDN